MEMREIVETLHEAFEVGHRAWVATMLRELVVELRRHDVRIPDHVQEERERLAAVADSLWQDVQRGADPEDVALVFQSAFKCHHRRH